MSHLSHHHFKPTLNELPKRFVSAMKVLFDIMDDQKTGCINIRDIEKRWPCSRDSSNGLPSDVMECLRKVTPPNEMINFERFCAGLKMCLLRHRVGHRQALGNAAQWYRSQYLPQLGQVSEPRGRPSSVPLPDREERTLARHQPALKPPSISKSYSGPGRSLDNLAGNIAVRPSNTAAVRPSTVTAQHRSVSVPHLQGKELSRQTADVRRIPSKLRGYRSDVRLAELRGDHEVGAQRLSGVKNKILDQSVDAAKPCTQIPIREPLSVKVPEMRHQKENVVPAPTGKEAGNADNKQSSSAALRKQTRKREPRRHTLGHGIEYSMLRRMKQLEQEKDVLVQGLRAVEHARDWYQQRISGVQEKMQNTSKGHAAPVREVMRKQSSTLTRNHKQGNLSLSGQAMKVLHAPCPVQQPKDGMTQRGIFH
ncbi:suppressor APC domain-containing protein 2-like isoform X2 [Ornithodoros turicata]|uniref:suppressor APC domain-containing protein 2-like isoform X2 n=1 Tax=Ornithodoros turicata TaxID=34597 RepID=UPI003138F8C1